MDLKEIYPLFRRNIVPIGLGVVGFLLLLAGLFQVFFHSKTQETAVVFEQSKSVVVKTQILVEVEGAVVTPGVYKLTSESRIVDALAAAGGLGPDADRDYVQKNIKLTGKLRDGLKIYIPRKGEDILTQSSSSGDSSIGPVMNINTASVSDLNTLPGVGNVIAQKIIDGRPYATAYELLSKKIIESAAYEKIKDKIAAN